MSLIGIYTTIVTQIERESVLAMTFQKVHIHFLEKFSVYSLLYLSVYAYNRIISFLQNINVLYTINVVDISNYICKCWPGSIFFQINFYTRLILLLIGNVSDCKKNIFNLISRQSWKWLDCLYLQALSLTCWLCEMNF
jgi:hypothetical protein